MRKRIFSVVAVLILAMNLLVVISNASPAAAATLAPLQVVTGATDSCALSAAGQAYCWGSNQYGTVGDNTTVDRAAPVAVAQGGLIFTSISMGDSHACALTATGQAYCWGYNLYGQIGYGGSITKLAPTAVSQTGLTFVSIGVGDSSTCALTSVGTVYCWGRNTYGQIGDNTTTNRLSPTAVQQGALVFTALSVGAYTVCALVSSGQAYCWGDGISGQLGNGSNYNSSVPAAVQQGAVTFSALSTAGTACAITSAGAAYCWGGNFSGSVGDGTTTNRNVPVAVQQGAIVFASVVGGNNFNCGLTVANVGYCWGSNNFGNLGDSTYTNRLTPTLVTGGLTWSSIMTNDFANGVCGVKSNTQLIYCWGQRINGRLGDNTPVQQTLPVTVQGGLTFSSIAAGGGSSTCGLSGGTVYCWGNNANGQLGDGTTDPHLAPTPVSQGALTFKALAGGNSGFCALTTVGTAYCWGFNSTGQIGDGSTTTRFVPTAVSQGALAFTSISMGASHVCALTAAGAAYCWGYNNSGQVGDGTTNLDYTPVAVQQGALVFNSIVTGGSFTCALAGGQTYCWGDDSYGTLGDGTGTNSSVPVATSQSSVSYTAIAAGYKHACAVATTGQAYCWGLNTNGQLGDNTSNAQRMTPVAVFQGATSFTSITANVSSTCAIRNNAVTYCWGGNSNGQLGNATTTDTKAPSISGSGRAFSSVTASELSYSFCGLNNGAAFCWGADSYGQLGDSPPNATSPTQAWYFLSLAAADVSATIDPTFTFAIANQPTACNGESNFVSGAGSASAVSLGHVTTSANVSGGQALSVASNAGSGFTIYIRGTQASQDLRSTGHNWNDVSGTYSSPATLGSGEAFGYTYKDATASSSITNPASATFAGLDATNRAVAGSSSSPTGSACVSFDAQTSATTAAGSYSATIIYTAVPVF